MYILSSNVTCSLFTDKVQILFTYYGRTKIFLVIDFKRNSSAECEDVYVHPHLPTLFAPHL